ncbi:hypothetical protein U1Q18_039494, partial [Sarracenia purpurea var. burkii]
MTKGNQFGVLSGLDSDNLGDVIQALIDRSKVLSNLSSPRMGDVSQPDIRPLLVFRESAELRIKLLTMSKDPSFDHKCKNLVMSIVKVLEADEKLAKAPPFDSATMEILESRIRRLKCLTPIKIIDLSRELKPGSDTLKKDEGLLLGKSTKDEDKNGGTRGDAGGKPSGVISPLCEGEDTRRNTMKLKSIRSDSAQEKGSGEQGLAVTPLPLFLGPVVGKPVVTGAGMGVATEEFNSDSGRDSEGEEQESEDEDTASNENSGDDFKVEHGTIPKQELCASEVRFPCSSDVISAPIYDLDVNVVENLHSLRVEGDKSLRFGENSRSPEGALKVLDKLSKTIPVMNKQGVSNPKSLDSWPRAAKNVDLGVDLSPEGLEGDRDKHAGEIRPQSFFEAHLTRTWAKVIGNFPKQYPGTPGLNQRNTSHTNLEYFAPDTPGVIDIRNDMFDDRSWGTCLVGYFLDKSLAFGLVRATVMTLWNNEGLLE